MGNLLLVFVIIAVVFSLPRTAAWGTVAPMRRRISRPTTNRIIHVNTPWHLHATNDKDNDEKSPVQTSDWKEAARILDVLPSEPAADLPPDVVAMAVCRSLQWVDYPTPAAGLERCFPFLTWQCRKCVTARQGGDTVERFCQYGLLAPALQVFMGAHRLDWGEATLTPAHPPLRGALYSVTVTVKGAPILSVRYQSGLDRPGVGRPPTTQMIVRLEEQRRPPHQGCWLVQEILDVNHAFDGDLGNVGVGG